MFRNSIMLVTTLFIMTMFMAHCKILAPSAEVKYLGEYEKGTIDLKVIGYGRNKMEAIEDAEKRAFEVLLFRGIPGSRQENAMIYSGNVVRKKYHRFVNGFFTKKGYRSFLTKSESVSNIAGYKTGLKKVNLTVNINLFALRKHLEQNNIVRMFEL